MKQIYIQVDPTKIPMSTSQSGGVKTLLTHTTTDRSTIRAVKTSIQKELRRTSSRLVSIDQMLLTYGNTVLENHRTVGFYNIPAGANVSLTKQPRRTKTTRPAEVTTEIVPQQSEHTDTLSLAPITDAVLISMGHMVAHALIANQKSQAAQPQNTLHTQNNSAPPLAADNNGVEANNNISSTTNTNATTNRMSLDIPSFWNDILDAAFLVSTAAAFVMSLLANSSLSIGTAISMDGLCAIVIASAVILGASCGAIIHHARYTR